MREDEGSAELAERVLGDAYHSYLAKCIKTTTPRNIELTELIYDSLRAQRGHILLALGRTRVQRQDSFLPGEGLYFTVRGWSRLPSDISACETLEC